MRSFKNGIFYTLGKFLVIVFIAFILSLLVSFFDVDLTTILFDVDNVYAESNDGWAVNNNLEILGAYSQSSLNNSNDSSFISVTYSMSNSSRAVLHHAKGGLGRYISFGVPKMNNNYAYLVNAYFCYYNNTTADLPSVDNVYTGNDIYSADDDIPVNISSRRMSLFPFGPNYNFGDCRLYSVKLDITGGARRFIVFHFSNAPASGMYFMGFRFYPLGTAYSSLSQVTGQIYQNVSGLSNSLNSTKTDIINNANSNKNVIVNNANSNTNRAISNATENTNRQISNDNQNTDKIISNANENTNKQISNLNDDNEQEIKTQGNEFFDMFGDYKYGLSDVLTLPLEYIESMTDAECHPLEFTLPFVHNHVSLPCMTPIYETHFPTFLSLWQVITTGIIAYWVTVNLFALFKRFRDPTDDKVEVMDL